MLRGRRLAFDYGDVRIGVAVCDPDGILATPVITLKNNDEHLWEQIDELIEEYEPIHIYVGAPKHMSGAPSASMLKAEEFKDSISINWDNMKSNNRPYSSSYKFLIYLGFRELLN